MTYEEYQRDLTDQIGNKRAKKMVMQEIDNHIEELTEQYEKEGLSHEAAIEKAVAEMGDPQETGMALNAIHRPRFPYLLFAMAVFLSMFGILLQSKIFPEHLQAKMNPVELSQVVTYSGLGLLIAFIIVFFDYTMLVKNAYKIWGIYLSLVVMAPFMTGWPILSNAAMLSSVLTALFPILFAALLYRQRKEEWKGIIKSLAILFFSSLLIVRSRDFYSIGSCFLAETIFLCLFIMTAAIIKGIMGKQKKTMLAMTVFPPMAFLFALFTKKMPLTDYQTKLVDALVQPTKQSESNYTSSVIRKLSQQFTIGGSRSWEEQKNLLLPSRMPTDYAVNSMFCWFGIITGILVLLLLAVFLIASLFMALKQSNRISFLFGTVCSVTILVRSIFYVLNNFGLFISYATYFPFLKYGLGNAIVNGCYIGMIFCVYRNSHILGEYVKPEHALFIKI